MKYSLTVILVSCFLFLLYLIFKDHHNRRVVWGMFYNTLWVFIVAGVVNYLCVELGYWSYINDNPIHFPADLYFVWVVFWGIIPFYFLKGRHLVILLPSMLLIDISLMPFLEELNILHLSENWLIGELFMVGTVFFPGYYWAKISILNQQREVRAIFQIMIMSLFLFVILDFITINYLRDEIEL